MKKGYIGSELRRKKQFDKKRKKRQSKREQVELPRKINRERVLKQARKAMQKSIRPIFKHRRFIFKWLSPWRFAFKYNTDTKLWILGCYFFVIGINLKSKYDV